MLSSPCYGGPANGGFPPRSTLERGPAARRGPHHGPGSGGIRIAGVRRQLAARARAVGRSPAFLPGVVVIGGLITALILSPGGSSSLGTPNALTPLLPLPSAKAAPTTGTTPGLPVTEPSTGASSSPAAAAAAARPSTRPKPGPVYGVNLLIGAQSTFDHGAGGWTAAAPARASTVRSPVAAGAGALALRNTGSKTATLTAYSGSRASTWTRAWPGTRMLGHVSTRASAAAASTSVSVRFLDKAGRLLATAPGQQSANRSSGFLRTWDAVGVAPSGTTYAVLSVSFAGAASGAVHYVDNASLMALRAGSRAVAGPLRTSGNRILDAKGRTVILRGVNRAGLEGADTKLPTNDDIAQAKLWGANFVRLPLGEQFWLANSCYHRPNFVKQVDDAVRWVTSRGMVALLVLHWNTISNCGPYGQQPMADYPNAINFWKQVASRYKSNPLVAFDLYNEPHDISDAVWRNGGQVKWKGTTFQAAGMQQMYAAVRGTGATNLVFASGKSWANLWPKTAPLSGTNIVYAVHAYPCPVNPPPNCDNSAPYDPAQFFRYWTGPSLRYPVMVTEFGWPNPDDGAYVRNVIAYAEQHGWGWAAYTWGAETWGRFSLLSDAGPGRSYQPSATGAVVLAAYPGG